MSAPTPSSAPLRALALMFVAASSFAGMNALARGLRAIPWPMLALSRALFGLAAALAVARLRGGSLRVGDGAVMWERSLFGSLGMLCTFYALTHMPLADATALLNTTPLWIALIARVRLGERASRRVVLALATAFVGVILVERPGLRAGDLTGLVALTAGVSGAMAMVSLRRLAGERSDAVVLHFSAVASAVMLVLTLAWRAGGAEAPRVDSSMLLGLLALGAAASLGQFAMTHAYSLDLAARVGAASFAQVLLAVLFDRVFFHRAPSREAAVGIAMILLGGGILVRDARAEARAPRG